jgi:hypothetical protein
MTEQQFQNQINRLANTFGKNIYSTERCKIMWDELGHFSAEWFTKIVGEFIGTLRQAPLMNDFREVAALERERMWTIEKKQHASEANQAMKCLFGASDIAWMCKTIRVRVNGDMSDSDFSNFIRAIENTPKVGELKCCPKCQGTGYLWTTDADGYESVSRCSCPVGAQKSKAIPLGVA